MTAWRTALKKEAEKEAIEYAEVGEVMPDGTIYAGISPDTNHRMYAAPTDAPLPLEFNEAEKYARELEIGGNKDFRLPTKDELNVLFQNRDEGALMGTFNLAVFPSGCYWSSRLSSREPSAAWNQQFKDGTTDYDFRTFRLSVRCIRSVPVQQKKKS